MLSVSRKNNQAHEITGLFLYNCYGTFIQVLEGDSNVVKPLYEKLVKTRAIGELIYLAKKKYKNVVFPIGVWVLKT